LAAAAPELAGELAGLAPEELDKRCRRGGLVAGGSAQESAARLLAVAALAAGTLQVGGRVVGAMGRTMLVNGWLLQ
jgi:hypothetical protein